MTIQLPIRQAPACPAFADVVSQVAARAACDPAAVALRSATGVLTYLALDRRSDALAARLIAYGIGAEQLVAVGLDRSIDRIVATLAIWKSGGALLALDPSWPDARLAAIVADADCAAVIGDAAFAARLGPSHPRLVDPDAGDAPAAAHADRPDPDALAYVLYTSGSTGTPKGVEITHANLAALIGWHNDAFGVTAADRASHLAGLGFDAAIWEIWPYLGAGASVTLADEAVRHGVGLRDWLVDAGITIAFAPTALADRLVAADWPAATPLRWLLTGADRLLAPPPAGLPFALVNNYGPTECTVVATSAVIAPARPGAKAAPPPIGWPIAGTRIHLLDSGECVADGQVGEIHIGGAGVGRGYRGRPDLTAQAFIPDRFADEPGARLYRTGDLGVVLPDGQIGYRGRIDDQFKIRGHRIEPEEVACVLRGYPGVAACTVAGVEDDGGDPRLVAYLVLAPGNIPGAEAVAAWLRERLPDAMVPQAFVTLPALPLTANGKIDRAALPAPERATQLSGAGFAAPTTPCETRLAEILSDVLGQRAVGVDDNFFLLGGHSLLGTQVILRAADAFGIELTLRHLFLAPTIRKLAALIEAMITDQIASMSDDDVLRAAE